MKLSYVIVTHNRRERLLATLEHIRARTALARSQWETWVVDNASPDGSADAVARRYPEVALIRNRHNEGIPARNLALRRARGRYVLLLDDDSYPCSDVTERLLEYLDANSHIAAVTGRVILPDGRYEAAAFPAVLAGGASCVRRSVLEEVGYFPGEFFRQAEEYDLSFRIWHAGYRVERFEDLVFRHDKAAGSRDLACVHRMDTRNNLILLERYLPACMRGFYRRDWIQRYAALARHAGHAAAARRGRREARWWSLREALRGRRLLSSAALEAVFGWRHQADRVAEWAREHGVRRVAVGDFSKNVYATYRACCLCGLEIVAVSDPHRAYRSLRYRGIAVLDDQEAARRGAEGIVLSNTNPAVVERRVNELEALFDVPVLQLWSPQLLGSALRATTPRVPVNRG